MSKARPFSIYLLKNGFNAENSLKEENALGVPALGKNLPKDSILYILDNKPKPPWWRAFFGIQKKLDQVTKGSILFLNAGRRCFALCFGHVYHNLKDESYEYDFGLKVTLNSVDKNKLISTDILEPTKSRRKQIQPSVANDLTYFDFDRDSNILKKLTGKVKKEYEELFRQVTGSSNLRVSLKIIPDKLSNFCEKMLQLYEDNSYEDVFPGIRNIEPVKDPDTIKDLNLKLLEAFKSKDDTLAMCVPDLINYEERIGCCFSGGNRKIYNEVDIQNFYDHLEANEIEFDDVEAFYNFKLILTDENENTRDSFSIIKCLVFDTTVSDEQACYHLSDGGWYKVDKNYLTELSSELDGCYQEHTLIPYNHKKEADYNEAIQQWNKSYICLDTTNTSPPGETQIEPCDLYRSYNNIAELYHVKISTRSSSLSHLFNQGCNSVELIKMHESAKTKFQSLIKQKLNGNNEEEYINPIDKNKFKVIYVIVTRKNENEKSKNLPLFSRISLMRNIRSMKMWEVDAVFCFVKNESPKKSSNSKRKSKNRTKSS